MRARDSVPPATQFYKITPVHPNKTRFDILSILPPPLLINYNFGTIQHPPIEALEVTQFKLPDYTPKTPEDWDRFYRKLCSPSKMEPLLPYMQSRAFTDPVPDLGSVNMGRLLMGTTLADTASGLTQQRYLLTPYAFSLSPNSISTEKSLAMRQVATVYFMTIAGLRDWVPKTHLYLHKDGGIVSRRFIRGFDFANAFDMTPNPVHLYLNQLSAQDKQTLIRDLISNIALMCLMGTLDGWNSKNLLVADRSEVATSKFVNIDFEFAFPTRPIYDAYCNVTATPPQMEAGHIPLSFLWRQAMVKKVGQDKFLNFMMRMGMPHMDLLGDCLGGDPTMKVSDWNALILDCEVDRDFLINLVKVKPDLDTILKAFAVFSPNEIASNSQTYQLYIQRIETALKANQKVTLRDMVLAFQTSPTMD